MDSGRKDVKRKSYESMAMLHQRSTGPHALGLAWLSITPYDIPT